MWQLQRHLLAVYSGQGARSRHNDVYKLQRRIAEELDKLEQRIIDKAVGEWQKRLRACVAASGGQFEHKMWTFIISDFFVSEFSDPTL